MHLKFSFPKLRQMFCRKCHFQDIYCSGDECLKVRDHVLGTQSLVLHPLVGLI